MRGDHDYAVIVLVWWRAMVWRWAFFSDFVGMVSHMFSGFTIADEPKQLLLQTLTFYNQ